MKINVVAIAKPEKDEYAAICERFVKMAGRFGRIETVELFDAKTRKAQENGETTAKARYAELFTPWLKRGYTVALDPSAKTPTTEKFAKLLEGRGEVTFFIGGAYGHGEAFLKSCDARVGLSPLTMSHKVAKVVLFEQIYRALTLINGHPYHK